MIFDAGRKIPSKLRHAAQRCVCVYFERVNSSGVRRVYERGMLGGMARPSCLLGVAGGGVALKPAFARYGDHKVQPSRKPPKHIAKGRPISGNLSRVPEIVRARDGDPVLANQ